MSFVRDRQRAIRRSGRHGSADVGGPQEIERAPSTVDEGVNSTRSLGTMNRDDLTPTPGADTPAKGRSAQDERKVYEEQLGQLQEQLEALMIKEMELQLYIKELEEDRNGKKQHQAQKKELEKLARENEELKERLKDFSSRESVSRPLTTTERGVESIRPGLAPPAEPPSSGAGTTLGRWSRSAQVVTWDWLCQLASDFSEVTPVPDGGVKDETTPLSVKRLKTNLTRLGKASKPLREFITFVVDVLRFKNKSETLVVFLVYMYCVWNGWIIQLLLLMAILKLSMNYLYESHLAEQFGFYRVTPTEESDADMGLGDTFNLVKQVAQSVQNIAEQVADALEKLSNLMKWHPAHATVQLYRTLWVVFMFSLFLPNTYVISFIGLFLGVKLFIIDQVYRNYPKVKERYDSVAKIYKQLLTHEQLTAQSISGEQTTTSRQLSLDVDSKTGSYCAVMSEECPDFSAKFGLGLDEQPLAGWQSGRKCTLMDKERPMIGSKGGTLYLTHSCLCFESKSFEKTVIHLGDVASVSKSKPFSFLPGSGMAIEIILKLPDKSLLFGTILNRDQVLDAILEQGFLLDLPWGLDRNQALKNSMPAAVNTEEATLEAEFNESSL